MREVSGEANETANRVRVTGAEPRRHLLVMLMRSNLVLQPLGTMA